MKLKHFAILIACTLIYGCYNSNSNYKLKKGDWVFQLQIDKDNPQLTIPFNVEVLDSNLLVVKNSAERIEVSEITYKNDSVYIVMPVFGSEFKAKLSGNSISGDYYNYNKSKIVHIPFTGKFGVKDRFETIGKATFDFSGAWQAIFSPGENQSPAIGIFKQTGNIVTGTFQTEIGDYRYLQGVVNGNTMKLSCFDGAHAFLYTTRQSNGKLEGMFYSGNTWEQKWVAWKTDDPELGDMKSLTFLKPGFDRITFSFQNDKQEFISLEDEKYKGKVVIVQILGTWCPNCMDETRYLVELYNKYNSNGLEIIGLDFETKPDFEYFKKRITRYRKDLNVPYELVLAGPSNKKHAAEALPMLNKIISYPTAIFIDRNGKVREIHTGFSGPGTGDDYEHYKKATEELIEKLLEE